MLTTPTPFSCEIFWAIRVSAMSSTFGQRHHVGGDAKGENGSVSRVDFGVDRRGGQVLRQEILRGADRCLHFLLCDVDGERKGKLQCDHGRAAGGSSRTSQLKPGIWPNCFSSGAVIADVITSGLAPG